MGKYTVFKTEDWENHLLALAPVIEAAHARMILPSPLKDAEVIRLQDVTAAPLLHAYASITKSVEEVLAARGVTVDLTEQSDWAHEAAIRSESMNRRLPD